MLRTMILATVLALPTAAFAAGSDDTAKPKKTETTKDCFQARQWDPETKAYVRFSQPVNGIWDANINKCVRPDKTSHLDSDTLYKAVRELAYAGRYNEAIQVLDQMPEQLDDRVLTYRGFTARHWLRYSDSRNILQFDITFAFAKGKTEKVVPPQYFSYTL